MKRITVGLICLMTSVSLAQTSFAQNKGKSPLADIPGFGHNFEADEKQYVKEENARRRMIGKCMKQAGHKFWPTLVSPSLKEPNFKRGDKLPNKTRKNNDYIESLSGAEQEAYFLTLYGIADPNDPENLWDPSTGVGGGCEGEAMRAIPGVFSVRNEVAEELATMRIEALNSSEVGAVEEEWSQCMKGKGKTFKSPKDLMMARDMELRSKVKNGNANGKSSVDGALNDDISCRKSVGFKEKLNKAIIDKETKFMAKHKNKIDKAHNKYKAQKPLE